MTKRDTERFIAAIERLTQAINDLRLALAPLDAKPPVTPPRKRKAGNVVPFPRR